MTEKAFFFQRLNDHVQYLKKIQATLEGKGEFEGSDFHDCKLGKWIYGNGPEEASAVSDDARRLFDMLLEPHKEFHEVSHLAVKMQHEGDTQGAREAVTKMHKLSTVLVNQLLELDKLSN